MPLPRGRVRIPVEVEKDREAKQRLKDVEKSLDDLGGGWEGLERAMRGAGPAAAVTLAGIGAVAAGARAAVDALAAMARGVERLVEVGSQLSASRSSLDAIASADFVQRLQSAGQGMLANAELFARANQILTAGFADENRVVQGFDLIIQAARASGRDVSEAIERITDSLSGGEIGLEDFGVNVLRAEEAAEALGFTVESQQGRLAALDNVLGQLEERYGSTSAATANLGSTFTQITTTVENWIAEVGRAVVNDRELSETFDAILEGIRATLPDAKEWGTELARLIGDTVEGLVALADATIPVARGFIALARAANAVGGTLEEVTNPLAWARRLLTDAPSPTSSWERALSSLDGALEGVGRVTSRVNGEVQSVSRQFERLSSQALTAEGAQRRLGQSSDQLVVDMEELDSKIGRTEGTVRSLNREIADDQRGAITLIDRLAGRASRAASSFDSMARAIDRTNQNLLDQRLAAGGTGPLDLGAGAAAPPAEAGKAEQGPAARFSQEQILAADRARREEENALLQRNLQNASQMEARRSAGAQAASQRWEEAMRQAEEALRAELEVIQQEEEAQAALHDAEMTGAQERKAFEQEAHRERMEQLAEVARFNAVQRDILREWNSEQERLNAVQKDIEIEAAEERRAAAEAEHEAEQARITSTLENVRTLADASLGLMTSIGQLVAANEQDAEKRKRIEGGFLIAYSSVKAAVELAESIGAFARQDYVAGATHLLAMGAYITAAAKAGSELGGGTAAVPSSSYAPARAEEATPTQQTGDRITYVDYSLTKTNATGELGRVMNRAQYEASASFQPMQAPPGMGWE